MPIASYEKEWKTIKTNFEKATNKKKPSDKFMGVFNKASGLTPATAAFDKAVAKDDLKAAADSLTALQKAAKDYQVTLSKAVVAEKDKTVQAETKVMFNEISNLLDEAGKTVKGVGKMSWCTTIGDFDKLLKNKANADRVVEFAKKTHNQELVLFLAAMSKKDYSAKTYKMFVVEGSPQEINIDAGLRNKFSEDNLRAAPWDDATKEVLKLFNTSIVTKLNA